jgi:hypothetical protein
LNGLPPPLIIPIFAVFVVLLAVIVSMTLPPRHSLGDDARELVEHGITTAEHSKALTILLRRGYEPDGPERSLGELPFWIWVVLAMLAIPTILLCITSSTAFEIGLGKRSVRWQKWHGNVLRKWMPGFIIMGVVASVVAAMIYERMRF